MLPNGVFVHIGPPSGPGRDLQVAVDDFGGHGHQQIGQAPGRIEQHGLVVVLHGPDQGRIITRRIDLRSNILKEIPYSQRNNPLEIGGTLAGCSGLVLSVFSNDVYTLYVTFGLITGNLAAALVVSRHVDMAAFDIVGIQV